ncbi:tpr repeat containing exported protein [hydrocarbon metagenome]|uniref:Tpr repeat containing exported protein n=1 Tax=hydrocarbon metagenome TaxID=938273 RepID=A0A0W8FR60_9ZZZZ
MDEKMDAKMAVVDTDLTTLKKNVAALETMRTGQASAAADITDLRDNIQQLRGQVETLKKDFTSNTKKEDQRFDNIMLKINFIENFLEIGNKNNLSDAADKSSKSTAGSTTKDTAKKQDKEKAYSAAYQIFREGNYDKARTEFQNYLSAYPDSEYSDNAQFWVGECYFFEQKYEAAILEYEKVTKNYPNGNKVPYALLKQGMSFLKLGDKTSAKLLLQQVIKNYPNTSQARIARSSLQEIK